MLCKDCNSKLEVQYRVFNWEYDCSDKCFKTLKEAEIYYNKMVKEENYLKWRLYEDTYCRKCDIDIENCLNGNFE